MLIKTGEMMELKVSNLTVVGKAFLRLGITWDIDVNIMAHSLDHSLRVYYDPMMGMSLKKWH